MPNVYAIAFRGDRFLMVYNPKRGGWEMPGGKLEGLETPLDGILREYLEECGFELEVLDCRSMGDVVVFAGVLGGKKGDGEMEWALLEDLPQCLAFPECEYREHIAWAKEVVRNRLGKDLTLKY